MHPSPASTPLLQQPLNPLPNAALQQLQQLSPLQMVSKWGGGKQHALMTAAQQNPWQLKSSSVQATAGKTPTSMDMQGLQNLMVPWRNQTVKKMAG